MKAPKRNFAGLCMSKIQNKETIHQQVLKERFNVINRFSVSWFIWTSHKFPKYFELISVTFCPCNLRFFKVHLKYLRHEILLEKSVEIRFFFSSSQQIFILTYQCVSCLTLRVLEFLIFLTLWQLFIQVWPTTSFFKKPWNLLMLSSFHSSFF